MAVAGRANPDTARAEDERTVPATPHWLTILAFLTIVLVLGVNFVAVRFSNRELPPFSGAALRFFLASAILFAVVRLQRLALPRGHALQGVLIYGALAFGVTYACLYWGLVSVPAGMAAVLFARASSVFSPLATTSATILLTPGLPSSSLVCPRYCGSGTFTVTTAVRPSRTSSLMTGSSLARSTRVAFMT